MMNKSIVPVVIAALKEINVDGETMEHIINEVGMRDQMIKQLVTNEQEMEPEFDSAGFSIEDREPMIMARFTRQQLIEYTREIQQRAMKAAEAAIEGTGGDFEQYVELHLNCNMSGNYIEINVDEHGILREVIDNIHDVFETDDESVLDEACNVLDHLAER
jgi:hypothetical protein